VLKCSTSLWSADLANLEPEMKRVEPYSDRFHIDVADGHYVKNLLFFPDLVKALRKHTRLPFEVHLMTTDPLSWIDPFVEAGADGIIFCLDSARDAAELLRIIKSNGKFAGVSLLIQEPIELLDPCWDYLDIVTVRGHRYGNQGCINGSDGATKIRHVRARIAERGLGTEIESDGGIRRETVPLLHAAGSDFIVPGSLMFGGDPQELHRWLKSL
jgi:ribulose-phosphate 3-epimerase